MSYETTKIIKAIYEAFALGDVGTVMGLMSPDIIWNEAENHPYADGNPYVGPAAVAQGVFARFESDWDGFGLVIDEMFSAEDVVIAFGRYHGSFKATGQSQSSQMVHVWRVKDGKAIRFQQYADTLQFARVMGVV